MDNEYSPYHQSVILGGAQLGLRYGITNCRFLSYPALYEILDKATYLGFRSWDMAQAYGCAEARTALWLRKRKWQFPVRFGSKIQIELPSGQQRLDKLFGLGFCGQQSQLRSRLRQSRLQLGNLDYILLHGAQRGQMHQQLQILGTLGVLGATGGNSKIGLSLYYPSELEELLHHLEQGSCPKIKVLQLPYSLADRRFEPYFTRIHHLGIDLQLRSLYLQGLLFEEEDQLHRYPASLMPLAQLLRLLTQLENSCFVLRQDILLYAGLRQVILPVNKLPSVRLVLGISRPSELLQLHHSLLRIAKWPNELRNQLEMGLSELSELGRCAAQLGPKVLVPALWQ